MKWFSSFASRTPPRPKRLPGGPQTDPELSRCAAQWLRALGYDALSEQVAVAWHRRLTSTAGLARTAQALVLLNPRLKTFPDEVERTLRHELAHLLAFDRARGRRIAAHGKEWKQACADLGIPGESRCHALPLPRRQVRHRHLYQCPRCGFQLRRVRPIKPRRRLACHDCCKNFARGRFDKRFEFIKIPLGAESFRRPALHTASCPSRIESMVQQTLNLLFPMKESTKDKVSGAINETTGKIKEKVGAKTNDPNLQDQGTGEKVKGKVQSKIGDIKKVFEK